MVRASVCAYVRYGTDFGSFGIVVGVGHLTVKHHQTAQRERRIGVAKHDKQMQHRTAEVDCAVNAPGPAISGPVASVGHQTHITASMESRLTLYGHGHYCFRQRNSVP
jgi:hypothetical protein